MIDIATFVVCCKRNLGDVYVWGVYVCVCVCVCVCVWGGGGGGGGKGAKFRFFCILYHH